MRNIIIIFIVLVVAIFYLSYYNPNEVTFNLGGKEVKTSIAVLMSASFLVGVIFSFLLQLFSIILDWTHNTFMKLKTVKERRAASVLSSAKEAFERGDIEEGFRLTRESIELKKDFSDASIFLARLKIFTNSFEEAGRILKEEVSKENPPLEAVLLYLNLSLKEELPDAIEIGRKKIALNGRSPLLLRAMARACDKYHLHDEAIEYQKKLLKIEGWNKDSEKGFYAYLLFRSGEEKLKSGDEDGIKFIKKSMDFLPFFTPAVNELTKFYVKNGDVRKAKELAQEAFSKNFSHSILISLEKTLLDADIPAEAIEFYTELNEKFNEISLRFLTVKLLLKLEMIEPAEEIMRELHQEIADSTPFRYLSAILSAKKGNFSDAYKLIEEIGEEGWFTLWMCSVCRWKGAAYTAICPNCGSVDSIRISL